MTSLDELKKRKVVQWALAYLAGAWVVLQLVAILAGQFGWPAFVQRGITILLAVGFFVALIVAWYHGEKGRQRVSGLELLMLAGILVVAGAAITLVREDPGGGADGAAGASAALDVEPADVSASPRSVAVLPLDDHSPTEEHAWFAEAMTEEITTALSKVPELRVTSRSTASKFPESGQSVREFARGVGVAHVLEGSVRRVGDQVRITVQLIDARTDEHLWSETFERQLLDVLNAQVEIARQVADRLAATFTERDRQRILAGSTDDPVAYDYYLRAFESGTPTVEWLRRAVERDSSFALAWGELGGEYYWERVYTADDRWRDSLRLALDRAVALTDDPSLALKYRAWKVWSLAEDREELLEAITLLRQAVEANPGAPSLVGTLGYAYESSGDLTAAARWRRRLVRLDPLSAGAWSSLAWTYILLGLDERAEQAARRGAEADPASASPWDMLQELWLVQGRFGDALAAVDSVRRRDDTEADLQEGETLTWTGDFQGAREAFRRVPEPEVRNTYGLSPNRALAHLALGDPARARSILSEVREMAERAPTDPHLRYARLAIPALMGDREEAVRTLREYANQGGRMARFIRTSPLFADVRDDPAFEVELSRIEEVVDQQRRQVVRELADGR